MSTLQVEIRRCTEDDIPSLMEMKNRLGWNQLPADFRRFLGLAPQSFFGAQYGDRLAGTAVVFYFGPVAWIALVMVRDDCRRKGIGRALMVQCLEDARSRGCGLVKLDATREGEPLYRELGFREEYGIGLARGTLDTLRLPPRGRAAVRRVAESDLDAVIALDREAFGAERRELLGRLFRDYPEGGWMLEEGRGFVLLRPGFHSWCIGPLVAETDRQAERLLQEAVGQVAREETRAGIILTFPLDHPKAQALYRRWGLACTPRLVRMVYGAGSIPARPDLLYASSGAEKG
jgi:ribosomal protein S18 acetylase RimI-like enzyme